MPDREDCRGAVVVDGGRRQTGEPAVVVRIVVPRAQIAADGARACVSEPNRSGNAGHQLVEHAALLQAPFDAGDDEVLGEPDVSVELRQEDLADGVGVA